MSYSGTTAKRLSVAHRGTGWRGHDWTPARLSAAVGWWRADSISQADGSAVSAWTDKIKGTTLLQPTGAKQPTYHDGASAQAIGGRPVVTFAGGAAQRLSVASPAGIPLAGPLTYFIVYRATTGGTYRVIVDYMGSTTSKGYGLGPSGSSNLVGFFPYGATNVFAGWPDDGTGGPQLFGWQIDATNHLAWLHSLQSNPRANTVSPIVQTPLTFSIGCRITDDLPFTGHVAEMIVLNATATATELNALSAYMWDRYGGVFIAGTSYNAPAALTTPSYDGSNSCVEQGIVDFGAGNTWRGHRYWMAMVPWVSVVQENPGVLCSDDGITWSVPAGGSNPVRAYPGGGNAGNNSDPGLVYDPDGDRLVLTWNVENATDGTNGIWAQTTTDGITWAGVTQLYAWTVNHEAGEPILVRTAANSWTLLAINNLDHAAPRLMRWTSTTGPTGTFTAQSDAGPATMNRPGSYVYHWGSPVKIGSKWVGLATDGGNGTPITAGFAYQCLWMWSSTDLVHFTWSRHPVLVPSDFTNTSARWDDYSMYTGSLLDAGDGANLIAYYTGLDVATTTFHLGRTTIPLTEIP